MPLGQSLRTFPRPQDVKSFMLYYIVVKLGREGQLEYNGKPVSAETLGALLEADLEARSLGSVIGFAFNNACV